MSWNRGAAEFTMVDAFTDRPFTGNPAAVYLLPGAADAGWMQAVAALGVYWAERLGQSDLVGYQASRRGGVVHVRPRGAWTHLRGQAVTVMRGELVC